jgi:hypothetical protein
MDLRRALRWIPAALALAGCAALAVAVAYGAVKDAESLQGVTVAVFMAFLVFVYFSRRPGQEWARGNWPYYVAGALICRLLAGFVHLFVAFYLFNQMVDFVGLHDWVMEAGQRLVAGALLDVGHYGILESGAVVLLMMPFYLVIGTSIAGMLLISGLIGFVGSYLFLRSFQIAGPQNGDVSFLGKVLFFLPSFIFWGSLFGKDSVTLLCLGLAAYCVARLSQRIQFGPAVWLLVAMAFIAVIRPHVGAALGGAVGIAWFLSRMSRPGVDGVLVPVRVMFRAAVLAVMIVVPTIILSSMINRDVSLEAVYKDMARRHYVLSSAGDDAGVGGLGSSLPPRLIGDSPWEFVEYLPEGFLTFIFRPLPFDAHNTQALIASSEGTLLVGIVLWRRRQLWRSLRTMWSSPYLTFCVGYFFLATTALCFERNLGLIARHKIMVLPYLMIMLAVPLRKSRRVEGTTRPRDDHELTVLQDERGGAS